MLESAKDQDTEARILAEGAETAGGRDNITTVVVDITGTGLAAGPVGDRVRRVVVPPTDLSDIEALLVAAQDESDESNEIDDVDTTANFPPVVATLADDDAAFEVETPAEAAARDAADDLLTADDEPVVVADAIERAYDRGTTLLRLVDPDGLTLQHQSLSAAAGGEERGRQLGTDGTADGRWQIWTGRRWRSIPAPIRPS